MNFRTIPAPAADQPALCPPCSGNWLRLADGSLQPGDEATARDAGLYEQPAAALGAAPEVEA